MSTLPAEAWFAARLLPKFFRLDSLAILEPNCKEFNTGRYHNIPVGCKINWWSAEANVNLDKENAPGLPSLALQQLALIQATEKP